MTESAAVEPKELIGHHDIKIQPGWMTVEALKAEGSAWGHYMATYLANMTEYNGGLGVHHDISNQSVIPKWEKDWKGTIASVRTHLPDRQVKIFEKAARRAFNAEMAKRRQAFRAASSQAFQLGMKMSGLPPIAGEGT